MPPKYITHTPVIFRMLGGQVIGILPTMPFNSSDGLCSAYKSNMGIIPIPLDVGLRSRLATRAEYMPLKKEMQNAGFRLRVVSRIAAAHNQERNQRRASL